MSKTRRFIIVILVLAVAFAFLYPSIQWYFLTPKEDQAIAVGSREQIRDYSRRMAYITISDLKQKAAANDTTDLSGQKTYKDAIEAARKAYSTAKSHCQRPGMQRQYLLPFQVNAQCSMRLNRAIESAF